MPLGGSDVAVVGREVFPRVRLCIYIDITVSYYCVYTLSPPCSNRITSYFKQFS